MGFALEIKKIPQDEIDRRINSAAELLGIGKLLERQPCQLSGGQRQRVALGRAIVRDPAAFLFDEPLSNLDAKLRASMRSELIKLHKRLGSTIVYVTHDQVEAMTMGQLVVVMKDGVIQQAGTPLEVYRNPKNVFVAEFIGSPAMNLVPAKTLVKAGEAFAVIGDTQVPLDRKTHNLERIQDGVTLGIRPEHLSLVDKGVPNQILVKGTVEVVETLGSESLVEVAVGGITFLARQMDEVLPVTGSGAQFHVEPKNLFVFDHQSGENLRLK